MGVFKKNGNWWIDFYDADRRRRRKKIGTSKTLAKHILRDIQAKIVRGEYLGPLDKKIPFREFSRSYLRHAKANLSPRAYERCEGIVRKHLIPHFERCLDKITPKDVEDYKQKRAERVKPATVNRELSRLRHMLKCAIDWGYIRSNPCKGVKELREPPGRVRYLNGEEMKELLDACTTEDFPSKLARAYLGVIVQIALHTGMRRGEILDLTWKDVDLKRGYITPEKTKNNERRAIPIGDTLHQALEGLPRHLHSEKLFPDINGNMVTMAFRRAVKRAGIKDFRFHDLRHTYASYLTMGGCGLRAVQTLLGHKSTRMTERYSHLSPEYLKEAVRNLEKSMNLVSDGHYLDTEKERGVSHDS